MRIFLTMKISRDCISGNSSEGMNLVNTRNGVELWSIFFPISYIYGYIHTLLPSIVSTPLPLLPTGTLTNKLARHPDSALNITLIEQKQPLQRCRTNSPHKSQLPRPLQKPHFSFPFRIYIGVEPVPEVLNLVLCSIAKADS